MKKLLELIKKSWKKRKQRKMEKIYSKFLNYFIVEMISFYEDKYNKEPKEFIIGERIIERMMMELPKKDRMDYIKLYGIKVKFYGIKVKVSDNFEIRLK